MKVIDTKFKGLKIIQQKRIGDSRGSLRETFRKKIINWDNLIFDYATSSRKNVIRGFHFQSKNIQAKFVNVLKGEILDCVIDLRKNSKTFGKVFKIVLSSKNCIGLFIPRGFAHAYLSIDKENIIYYKLDNYYNPKFENLASQSSSNNQGRGEKLDEEEASRVIEILKNDRLKNYEKQSFHGISKPFNRVNLFRST